MRVTQMMWSLGLWATLLATPAAAQPGAAGTVTPLTQERVVEASASTVLPRRVESTDMGPFDEMVSANGWTVFCAGVCVTLPVSSSATQRSLLTMARGALELRAWMSASGISVPRAGGANGTSRVRSTFALDAEVPYILQSDGSGSTRLVLEDANGRRVEEHVNQAAPFTHRGRLPPGSYTLTAQTATESFGTLGTGGRLDVRFTVGPEAEARPRCIVEMTATRYEFGDVVTASRLEVANQHAATPVELKMWLRLPDRREVPVYNAGADGSVAAPEAASHDFGPLDVMGVDDATPRGLYEFGCRLLNPTTGEQLDGDSDLFEVQ